MEDNIGKDKDSDEHFEQESLICSIIKIGAYKVLRYTMLKNRYNTEKFFKIFYKKVLTK